MSAPKAIGRAGMTAADALEGLQRVADAIRKAQHSLPAEDRRPMNPKLRQAIWRAGLR